ncbi:hypothetical protein BU17DRAFT_48237 [Hysterangium stoloniferum]|nr:hypothetical protein BU17DRAFT_48237 [Hysterangium stoloniferum]
MSPTSQSAKCAVCNQTTSYWCSRCQQSWYCSVEHLQRDWPHHKKSCKPAGNHEFAVNHTPDQAAPVVAIYFPTNEEKPFLITVDCVSPRDPSAGPCPNPLVQSWFSSGRCGTLTLTQGLNQEPLRFPLQVWYDSEALSRGTPVNRSVYRITSGQARRAWSGPVVVLKFSGSRRQGYTDATLNDLPALSAYFLGYN